MSAPTTAPTTTTSSERATISGVALTAGVSSNGNLYTPANLAEAVRNGEELIAEDKLLMRSHHAAADDSLRIVGIVTELRLSEDGQELLFDAELFPTSNGRDIATLCAPPHPVLAVSIRGVFETSGRVPHPDAKGRNVLAGSNLTVVGIDFTATPGVPTARILDLAAFNVATNGDLHGDDPRWAEASGHVIPEVSVVEQARVLRVVARQLGEQGGATVQETITRHRDTELAARIDRAIAARLAAMVMQGPAPTAPAPVAETQAPAAPAAPVWEQALAQQLGAADTARQLAALDGNDFLDLGRAYVASRTPGQ